MPLTDPAPRKLIHTRQIECKGYQREDGLWDIEAHLVDTKTTVHSRRAGGTERQPGDPIHNMWIRLTIDLDMVVLEAEAFTQDSPYTYCGNITPNFKRLVGVKIGPGWRKEIRMRLGGTNGCTHLVELLGPLGTTAYQSTGRARDERNKAHGIVKKPMQIGSCHVYKPDSDAVRERWPAFYQPTGEKKP